MRGEASRPDGRRRAPIRVTTAPWLRPRPGLMAWLGMVKRQPASNAKEVSDEMAWDRDGNVRRARPGCGRRGRTRIDHRRVPGGHVPAGGAIVRRGALWRRP